jgi:hypothetical protein
MRNTYRIAFLLAACFPALALAALDGISDDPMIAAFQVGFLLLVVLSPFIVGAIVLKLLWKLLVRFIVHRASEAQHKTGQAAVENVSDVWGWYWFLPLSFVVVPYLLLLISVGYSKYELDLKALGAEDVSSLSRLGLVLLIALIAASFCIALAGRSEWAKRAGNQWGLLAAGFALACGAWVLSGPVVALVYFVPVAVGFADLRRSQAAVR